jgi:hypothetical protein
MSLILKTPSQKHLSLPAGQAGQRYRLILLLTVAFRKDMNMVDLWQDFCSIISLSMRAAAKMSSVFYTIDAVDVYQEDA